MEKQRNLGWTTLEEAKKLVDAGLDPNTADMYYIKEPFMQIELHTRIDKFAEKIGGYPIEKENHYPCWSLGALLKLIPKNIKVNDESFQFYMSYDNTNKWSSVYESAFFKRRFFCSVFPNQMELLINVILWLLHNNHIKKHE